MGVRELSPELAALAKAELGEDPERREKDIQSIKEWLSKQRHIKARLDDQWILAFLRGCKFSLERTKEKLDTFYTLKTAVPEIAMGIDPLDAKVQEMLELGIIVPIVKVTSPDSPRITIVRPGQHDAIKVTIHDTMRLSHMFSAIMMMEDDHTTIAGQIYIVDLNNVTMNHFMQMTPSNIKKMVTSNQEGMPMRQKGSHHINTPAGFDTVFNLFKIFMNEKNKSRGIRVSEFSFLWPYAKTDKCMWPLEMKRFFWYCVFRDGVSSDIGNETLNTLKECYRLFAHNSDMEALYKYVPREILPEEYGGDAGPIQDMVDHWKKRISNYRDWFLEDLEYKTDESKRPGKPKTAETLFGIEGSFRQLTVD